MVKHWTEVLTSELRLAGQEPTEALPAVTDLLAKCAAAWPDIPLAPERFVQHLLAHWDRRDPIDRYLESTHVCDLYLASACHDGIPQALTHFDALYLQQVPAYIAHLRGEAAFVRDVRQAVAEKLLVGANARIGDYGGRAPLGGWVRVVCVRAAIDAGRAAGQRSECASLCSVAIADSGDLELDYIRDRYRVEFAEAFEVAVAGLPAEQRNLLRMYLVDRIPLNEVASRLRVSRMTVLRRVAAARQAIREHAQRNLRDRLRLSESEFHSIYRLVRSQLNFSVATLLNG